MDSITFQLDSIFKNKILPPKDRFLQLVNRTCSIFQTETEPLRPRNKKKQPGGFIDLSLNPNADAIIVPDIHARTDLVYNLIFTPLKKLGLKPNEDFPNEKTVLDKLENSTITILFLGDILHAERRAFDRWCLAYEAFIEGNPCSDAMKEEMAEGLNSMEMILLIKNRFPDLVHILKGNHENIENIDGNGDYAFHKFAAEGLMVKDFIVDTYGTDFLKQYSKLEHLLPFAAKGTHYFASHAEPFKPFSREEIINASLNATTIIGLTWTRDGECEKNSADLLLNTFFSNPKEVYYLAGHRSIKTSFNKRENSSFIQIHNPNLSQVAVIPHEGIPKPENLMKEIS